MPEICVSGCGDYQEQRLRSLNAKLKRGCGILLIASVVLLSILALLSDADVDHDAGYTASELSIRETIDGSVTSTSYVNPDGVITDAIDVGYATVCKMRDNDGRVVEERYLDAEENPVERSGGYSTIVRTQIGGRASDDFYYDLNGQQVQCAGEYYGLHCEFNTEGQNSEAVYPASWSTSASGNNAKIDRRTTDAISRIPHPRFSFAFKLRSLCS